MANILLTGTATLDIINLVSQYPSENDEIRALQQQFRRGGNAANSADVLSQLGHKVTLNCSLAQDSSAQFIRNDLERRHIDVISEATSQTASTPTSYITLNQSNGSRTIVHYRDLAELSFKHFDRLDLDSFDWFHFEGRNIQHSILMMEKARLTNRPVSVEIEKNRSDDDIKKLIPLADIILLSRPFVLSLGKTDAIECLQFFSKQFPDKIISCSWGQAGAWIINNSHLYHSPAYISTTIIDTIGAGDTYNAALINAFINQQGIDEALHSATKLAGLKCVQHGFNNLI